MRSVRESTVESTVVDAGRVALRVATSRATALFHTDASTGEGRDAEINLITDRVSIAVTVPSG